MNADDPRHGTRRGYYAHRRAGQEACERCKCAAASAQARYEVLRGRGFQSRMPPHGVQRRIRALSAIGYTWRRIDDELGEVSRQSEKWASGPVEYVFPRTHLKVCEVYERLCMTLPPETTPGEKRAASRSRNRAKARGWAPPLAWDNIDDPDEQPQGTASVATGCTDDDAVAERILAGDWDLKATRAQRLAVIERWCATGKSQNALERLTGWNVTRDLRDRGNEAARRRKGAAA